MQSASYGNDLALPLVYVFSTHFTTFPIDSTERQQLNSVITLAQPNDPRAIIEELFWGKNQNKSHSPSKKWTEEPCRLIISTHHTLQIQSQALPDVTDVYVFLLWDWPWQGMTLFHSWFLSQLCLSIQDFLHPIVEEIIRYFASHKFLNKIMLKDKVANLGQNPIIFSNLPLFLGLSHAADYIQGSV